MKALMKVWLVASIILWMAPASTAQDKKPAIPDPVKNLMKLPGNWEGNAELLYQGKLHKFMHHMNFEKIADGNGLYMLDSFSDPEMGNEKGGNLIGYDPNESKMHWFVVDNMGTTHDHIGTWKSPNDLYLENNSVQGGKKYTEKFEMIIKEKTELDLTSITTLDGKEISTYKATLHKKNGGSNK